MNIRILAATLALGLAATIPAAAQTRMTVLRPAGTLPQQQPATALAGDTDHQRIIALLTNLTSQVASLSQQVNQTAEALKALQVMVNLNMSSTDKARVAAINDGEAIANVQASVGGLTNSLAQVQANIASLKTSAAQTQASLASMQSGAAASQALQTDMARRLYMTCYMVAYGYVGPAGSRPYDLKSCTSGGWTGNHDFDTPFTTVYTVAPAVGGAAVPASGH